MNLHRKLAFMFQNMRKRRPYYCEVEYLEGTGTQWIDTGLQSLDVDTILETTFAVRSVSSTGNTFYGADSILTGLQRGKIAFTNIPVVADTFYTTKLVYNVGQARQIYVNGELAATASNYHYVAQIRLFGLGGSSSTQSVSPFVIKRTKITLDGVLHDFIPVLDWDMTPCMYDKVTEQLFYNAGTGDFIAGREIHPVDYLESTGTQYIDTGYKAIPATTKFEFSFTPTIVSDNTFLFGARPDTSAGAYTMTSYKAGARLRQDCAGSSSYFTNTLTTTGKYLFTAYNATVTLNDESYTGTITRSTTRSDYNFLLFTVNTVGTVDSRMFVGKIYYSKLWDNGTLVRDYYPAIDENGVGFMFDRVTHTIFDNAGTGAFSYPARELEYIESTGTQYINTGLKGKNGYDFDYKVNFTQLGGSLTNAVGGEWESGKACYFGMVRTTEKFAYNYQNTQSAIEVQSMTADTDYSIQAHLYSGSQYYVINGVNSAVGTITGTFTSTNNMRLFGVYSASPLFSYLKMYYCKIKDNGTLVRDYIPAFKDGSAGMLDKANNVFYSNQGTGTFVCGRILEEEYE